MPLTASARRLEYISALVVRCTPRCTAPPLGSSAERLGGPWAEERSPGVRKLGLCKHWCLHTHTLPWPRDGNTGQQAKAHQHQAEFDYPYHDQCNHVGAHIMMSAASQAPLLTYSPPCGGACPGSRK